jgi:hypothetical protein
MYRLRMQCCLLLAASLAACSDQNTPTAPAARPLAATAAVDRPYTWSFTCQSPALAFGITAKWWWLENGVEIAGTRLERSCWGHSTVSGSGTRLGNANGFTACVGQTPCQNWTFDPSGPFKAQLKGTLEYTTCSPTCTTWKSWGMLRVES